MSMTDRLVPGVTTVTLNARYYCLHGLIAAEAKRRGLDESAVKGPVAREWREQSEDPHDTRGMARLKTGACRGRRILPGNSTIQDA